MNRDVLHLLPAQPVDMGGTIVKQPLPTLRVDQVDPYLLLHHGSFSFQKGGRAIHQGIGPHPHRGFSPVTFIIDGELHHRDSFGNSQIAAAGDVQWMDAGAGMIHSERPSQDLVDRGGTQEVIQIWINTPSDKKMRPPQYAHIARGDMPELSEDTESLEMKLIAGAMDGMKGTARATDELLITWGSFHQETAYTWHIDPAFSATLYIVKGSVRLQGYGVVGAENLLVFGNSGTEITIEAGTGTQCLMLAGKPLNEKVVAQGPFVMNNETEILEAMRDYRMGKMGVLIEE